MSLVLIARAGRDAACNQITPHHTEGAEAMVHPMQYELERAYHQGREANAARQRLIEEAEHTDSAEAKPQRSLFEVAVRVWRRVNVQSLPVPSNAMLTESRTDV
jgi:hypothetical protein